MVYQIMRELIENGRSWNARPASDLIWEVFSNPTTVVDLGQSTCSCRGWQISGLPCVMPLSPYFRKCMVHMVMWTSSTTRRPIRKHINPSLYHSFIRVSIVEAVSLILLSINHDVGDLRAREFRPEERSSRKRCVVDDVVSWRITTRRHATWLRNEAFFDEFVLLFNNYLSFIWL